MSDANDNDRNASGRKPLTLTRNVGAGTVRQSFSHGRSKSVVVEMKKKHVIGAPKPSAAPVAGTAPRPAPAPGFQPAKPAAPAPAAPAAPKPAASGSRPTQTLGLSESEMKARQAALERARAMEADRQERARIEQEARARREEADRRRAEEDRKLAEAEAERRRAEEERRAQLEAAIAARKAAGEAVEIAAPEEEEAAPLDTAAGEPKRDLLAELGGRVKKQRVPLASLAPKPVSRTKGETQRRSGRLTVVTALEGSEDRQRSLASVKRAREKERERRLRMMRGQESSKIVRDVTIPEAITVGDLANRMAERVADVVKYLMREGTMATMNTVLDPDTAELIATDFGHNVKRVSDADVEIGIEGVADSEENLKARPPVVTIMGHVDHGKTSLLDAIRKTDVAAGEAGGITQHIGAYQVKLPTGEKVTFLDTPGHAAFSAMRARGAKVTDIVVLVVAADDGVMPQTVEAINHARASGVPLIVAVNKIDKPGANSSKVLTDLLQHEVVTEGFGGDVLAVEVSAVKKLNLDKLLETILLQSEVIQARANPDRTAEGAVIESKLDKGKGPVATLLVQKGTLKRGDIVVAGSQWGRVRALMNERGQQVSEVLPSEPIEVLGLDGAPDPGDVFVVVDSEQRAREITAYRDQVKKDKASLPSSRSTLENMLARIKDQDIKELPLIVKADVQGSGEAIVSAVEKLGSDEVRARVIHQAVGGINESDVLLAKTSKAPIIGFNVRASKQARELAEREGVEIRYYAIIYDLIDDIKGVLSGMLAPIQRESFLGTAAVLEVFNITKVGKVAGCRVTEGEMKRGAKVRILRDDVVIQETGTLTTLKRFKEDVAEVKSGFECGMSFGPFQDIKQGDVIECYVLETVQRTL